MYHPADMNKKTHNPTVPNLTLDTPNCPSPTKITQRRHVLPRPRKLCVVNRPQYISPWDHHSNHVAYYHSLGCLEIRVARKRLCTSYTSVPISRRFFEASPTLQRTQYEVCPPFQQHLGHCSTLEC